MWQESMQMPGVQNNRVNGLNSWLESPKEKLHLVTIQDKSFFKSISEYFKTWFENPGKGWNFIQKL